jgi:hypothetical protein
MYQLLKVRAYVTPRKEAASERVHVSRASRRQRHKRNWKLNFNNSPTTPDPASRPSHPLVLLHPAFGLATSSRLGLLLVIRFSNSIPPAKRITPGIPHGRESASSCLLLSVIAAKSRLLATTQPASRIQPGIHSQRHSEPGIRSRPWSDATPSQPRSRGASRWRQSPLHRRRTR